MRRTFQVTLFVFAILTHFLVLPFLVNAQAFQGYTLYSLNNSRNTYLIDMNNNEVHSWTHSKTGGYSCYLLNDGSLLRSAVSSNSTINGGGATGIIQRVDWYGNLLWEYTYSSSTFRAHHDLEPMPNGNVLVIAWEVKTAAESVQAGLNHSAVLWPDHILEIQPVGTNGGNIVWKWHFWDHLIQDYNSSKSNYGVVANHPELLDINVGSTFGDWMHINAISYNPVLDQIVISSHNLYELYVIDHSTTTQQAASHQGGKSGKGGDILYRWGKPANYRAPGSAVFKVVHCSYWVPDGLPGAGNIMAFNNREGLGTSMVVELVPPSNSSGQYTLTPGQAYGPSAPVWSYTASGFYSNHLGGCQRLPNGNTLIAQSTSGKLFEVTPAGNVVWSFQRTGEIPRALRYAPNYPGLSLLVPVEFSSFSAKLLENGVSLTWRTESETNNRGFEVVRNRVRKNGDLTGWEAIGFVDGHGTTNEPELYSFLDQLSGDWNEGETIIYRLCQIDYDGTRSYSPEVEVKIQDNSFALGQNYPNPSSGITNCDFQIPTSGFISLAIYDLLGRKVATVSEGEKSAGRFSAQFDTSTLPAGLYVLTLTSGERSVSRTMAVTR